MKTTAIPLLLAAMLTSSCARYTRQGDRWLLTSDDLALLQQQHARPHPQRRLGLDGRDIIYLDADDYFDDRGMRLLVEKMPNLQSISLMLCPRVTDEGLRHISALPHLKTLRLHHSSITDRSIRHVRKLKHLEFLDVSGTAVTASGLATLVRLPQLTDVYAFDLAFSATEKAMLKRVLGKRIVFDLTAEDVAQHTLAATTTEYSWARSWVEQHCVTSAVPIAQRVFVLRERRPRSACILEHRAGLTLGDVLQHAGVTTADVRVLRQIGPAKDQRFERADRTHEIQRLDLISIRDTPR